MQAGDPRLYYKTNLAVIERYLHFKLLVAESVFSRKVYPFTVSKMSATNKQAVLQSDFNVYMGKTAVIAHNTLVGNNSCVGEHT